ncbi:MAG: hypothetical protein V2A58_14060 [Planctomycetota bacterium]
MAVVAIAPAGKASALKRDKSPELNGFFGQGERLCWQAELQEGLTGEIWLSAHELQDFILIGGELENTTDKPVYVDDLCLCDILISRDDIDNARLFINSGSQGFSGSLSLADDRVHEAPCSSLCAFQGTSASDCLGIGSISMRRTEILLERELEEGGLHVRPIVAYDLVRLNPRQKLRLETLMINTDSRGGAYCLESWVESATTVIQPQFNRSLRGLYNTWYAYWTPTSDHGTAKLMLDAAKELEDSGLSHYGISATSLGVWHNRAALGETEPWPWIMQGHTMTELAEKLAEGGIQFEHGGFWGSVSGCSTVFKEHPEWMIKDKDGNPRQIAQESWCRCPSPKYALDLSVPEAFSWLKRHSADPVVTWGCKYYWLDFFGISGRKEGAVAGDETVCLPAEMERQLVRMIRESLGEGVRIGTYTSPTNRLVGLVDAVRMASDCGALERLPDSMEDGTDSISTQEAIDNRWKHVQACARNMGAAYFYNNRFWINDPDPIMVGLTDRPETLEEARVRVMIAANSGGFPTVGEAISHMAPGRLELLKKALPVYGQAARTIDVMDREVATVYHLHVNHPSGNWEILTIFNWDDESQKRTVDLDDIGLVGGYHGFEFWGQDYIGQMSRQLTYTIPARSCRVFRLTPIAGRPQVVGTDRHVTVGLKELPELYWHAAQNRLSGIARRPQPESGTITVFVPDGWNIEGVAGAKYQADGSIATIRAEFLTEGKHWNMTFSN